MENEAWNFLPFSLQDMLDIWLQFELSDNVWYHVMRLFVQVCFDGMSQI